MITDVPWVALKDVFKLYGYSSIGAARNAVVAGRFPVETYKVGRLIVIDTEVHKTFFLKHRQTGLRALEHNISLCGQQKRENDEP